MKNKLNKIYKIKYYIFNIMNQNICKLTQIFILIYIIIKFCTINNINLTEHLTNEVNEDILEYKHNNFHNGENIIKLLDFLLSKIDIDKVSSNELVGNDKLLYSSLRSVISFIYLNDKDNIEEYLQHLDPNLPIDEIIKKQQNKQDEFKNIKSKIDKIFMNEQQNTNNIKSISKILSDSTEPGIDKEIDMKIELQSIDEYTGISKELLTYMNSHHRYINDIPAFKYLAYDLHINQN